MVSDVVQKQAEGIQDATRKQVEGIQEQGFKRLLELSILVLSLEIAIFISVWCAVFDLGIPEQQWMCLEFYLSMLVVSLFFLIGIVYYFWKLRNTSQFFALFVKAKEENREVDNERFFKLIVILLGISAGLAFSTMGYVLYTGGNWWSLEHGVWWAFEHSILPPLIIVVSACAILYFSYRIKPERIQRTAHWLLFIPIIVTICEKFYEISANALVWYKGTLNHVAPLSALQFTTDITYFGFNVIFLATLILLLYLLYHVNVDHRSFHALAEGEHLQNLIEEGVWILPKRVHMNHTYASSLSVAFSREFKERTSHRDSPNASTDYLEAEIQGLGLDIDGEKRLKISVTSPLPTTTWIFRFTKPGIHAINLLINLVKPSDDSKDVVFMQTHNVMVDSFLTVSWPPALAFITPIIVTVVQILLKEGR